MVRPLIFDLADCWHNYANSCIKADYTKQGIAAAPMSKWNGSRFLEWPFRLSSPIARKRPVDVGVYVPREMIIITYGRKQNNFYLESEDFSEPFRGYVGTQHI